MPTPRLTNEILTAAIDGYEVQETRIDAKIAELRSLLSGGPTEPAATPEPTKRKRRKMSAAARARIERWSFLAQNAPILETANIPFPS